jgi:hypothetical protein
MKTTFLIIKVVSITHNDPMQIVDELQSFITKPEDNTENKEVIKSDIVELQTTPN